MTIRYVGMRDEGWGKRPSRAAEIEANEENEYDNTLFERTIALLKIRGWEFTEGCPGWAICEVEDRAEYDDFHREYKECQRCIRNCIKFGF